MTPMRDRTNDPKKPKLVLRIAAGLIAGGAFAWLAWEPAPKDVPGAASDAPSYEAVTAIPDEQADDN